MDDEEINLNNPDKGWWTRKKRIDVHVLLIGFPADQTSVVRNANISRLY